jgi:hypothetical protein
MARQVFTPRRLARLEAVDARFRPSRCRVMRRTESLQNGRRVAGDPEPVGPAVDCRLERAEREPREGVEVGRAGDETTGTVTLPVGTDVGPADLIEVTTERLAATETETFAVQGTPWLASLEAGLVANVVLEA